MYLTQGLHRALQRHPARTALRHVPAEGESPGDAVPPLSFAELVDTVARHAAAFAARGVEPGDRVALLAPNQPSLVVQLYACWWLGAVACPLNTRWSLPEWRAALDDSDARLLVADERAFGEAAAALADEVDAIGGHALAAEAAACTPRPDRRAGGDTLALLLYTGGTTGRAKGVMLTHGNCWSASIARAAELPNPPDSVSLLVAPLFHVAGLGRMIGQSIAGGAWLTMAQFRAGAVLEAIEHHGVSDIVVVPTMLQALLDAPGFEPARLQGLTRIAFGAAPMPPDLLDRALAAWPQAEFFQAYGLTETAGAVCINPPANHRRTDGPRLRSVGRAGLGAEIRVVDERGADCPRGSVGEVIARGPMVTPGYWGLPETTAHALRDGWLHTGDAGRMDDDGYLWIVDRLKDMIITGGENVYSAEVEAALRSHPAVADAAVVGLPDARWGERVHAVVVLRGGRGDGGPPALQETLTAWCRERLAGYKCPRSLAVADALPLSAAGKVLKHVLRSEAAR